MFSMKRWLFIPAFVLAAVVMAACAEATPAATPEATEAMTPAAAATEAMTPAATETTATTEAGTPAPTITPTIAPYTFKDDYTGPDCKTQTGPSPVKEVKATDANTVVFTLCNPDPAFLYKIALPSFGVEPAAYLEKNLGTGDLLTNPIGTGPYTFTEWKHGESITMTRNDNYWDTANLAKAKTLVFRWNQDASARLVDLKAGTSDGMDNVAPTDFDAVKSDNTLQLQLRDPLNIGYLGMNNKDKPFDDIHVRTAIAMALDRDHIVSTYFPEGSKVADFFTPCAIANACVGDKWYSFDANAAKAELAKAADPSVRNGFKTSIFLRDRTRPYQPQPQQIATDIQQQLKQNLNIDADIQIQESGTFLDNANAGKLNGLFMLGWIADYPYITDFLDIHFGQNDITFGDAYKDIYTQLAKGAVLAPDKAKDIYTAANNAVKADVPLIPIGNGASAAAFKADVKGAYAAPLADERFYSFDPGGRDTFVWLQSAEPESLYCNDEDDGEAIRACEQMIESLYAFKPDTTDVQPALATSCDPNADLTEWTCHIRPNVKFSDGSTLTAHDVVASFAIAWDASISIHKGDTTTFYFMDNTFGVINKPAS